MSDENRDVPDSTAVRTALWRALHLEMSARGAKTSGTPFVSFFTPAELVGMARDAGFAEARHVASRELAERYFAGRSDGLRPSSGEDILVATT
jgi:O-methyltransferase involved in polyketide biosynthesis